MLPLPQHICLLGHESLEVCSVPEMSQSHGPVSAQEKRDEGGTEGSHKGRRNRRIDGWLDG